MDLAGIGGRPGGKPPTWLVEGPRVFPGVDGTHGNKEPMP